VRRPPRLVARTLAVTVVAVAIPIAARIAHVAEPVLQELLGRRLA
jgi:hypothetical protein